MFLVIGTKKHFTYRCSTNTTGHPWASQGSSSFCHYCKLTFSSMQHYNHFWFLVCFFLNDTENTPWKHNEFENPLWRFIAKLHGIFDCRLLSFRQPMPSINNVSQELAVENNSSGSLAWNFFSHLVSSLHVDVIDFSLQWLNWKQIILCWVKMSLSTPCFFFLPNPTSLHLPVGSAGSSTWEHGQLLQDHICWERISPAPRYRVNFVRMSLQDEAYLIILLCWASSCCPFNY